MKTRTTAWILVAFCLLAGRAARCQNLSFDEQAVDPCFPGMACAVACDLDGDGDLDIVGGSEATPYNESWGVAWWRNEGGDPPSWTRFPVDTSFDNVMSVAVADLDGDGRLEIVATSWNDHQIARFAHVGPPGSLWIRRLVLDSFTNAHDAECADLDLDGDLDVVGINSTPGGVVVCASDGAATPAWTVQALAPPMAGGKAVSLLDLDRDGDTDIVACAMDDHAVAWWENRGGSPPAWVHHPISSEFGGCVEIDPVDMNSDGLVDLLVADATDGAVYRLLCEDLAAGLWTRHLVASSLAVATNVRGRDFDDDGDIDVAAVAKIPGRLAVYEDLGGTWHPHDLEADFLGGWALACADVNGDGDLDILAGASALGILDLYENTSHLVGAGPAPAADGLRLAPSFPNPFNPRTAIGFSLPEAGTAAITVCSPDGAVVRTLLDARRPAGDHRVVWDGRDDAGRRVPSGVYLCRLRAGGRVAARKMVLLK